MAGVKQVNICGSADDLFQRYKRDQIQIEFKTKCGGQTRITNLDTICKQLRIEKKIVVKEFQKTLSVSLQNGDTIPGKISVLTLENVLEKLIPKYILCWNCGLPELDQDRRCNSCGFLCRKSSSKVGEDTNKV